jgi:ABC-type phosphate transport system substrate-binding protein
MKAQSYIYRCAACAVVLSCLVLFVSVTYPAIKNMAVVVAADSNLPDLTMVEFTKLCKGTQKSWPDGRTFTLVLKDPTSPEMHVAVQKLFGASPADAKTAIAKINEVRPLIKIVASDEDVFRTVTTTPGAVGLVDVYSINSAVKVLHIDGKLPFDVGYALK